MPLGVLLGLMLQRWLNTKRRIPRQMASTRQLNTKRHVSNPLSIAAMTLEQIDFKGNTFASANGRTLSAKQSIHLA